MSDVDVLTQRLQQSFDKAKRRVDDYQVAAGKSFEELQTRYQKFVAILDRVGPTIVRPRLEAMLNHFPGVQTKPVFTRQGREVTLNFDQTPDCPATVRLKFSVHHDEEIQNVLLKYELDILPMYVQFEQSSTLELPLEDVTDEAVIQWLDDRLVAFVDTYLSLQFVDQYQRDHMVVDPVMQVRFPKNFAHGQFDYQGQTYYFVSEQTQEAFVKNPAEVLAGPGNSPQS